MICGIGAIVVSLENRLRGSRLEDAIETRFFGGGTSFVSVCE
jgi:hypothetical protein